MGVMTKRTYLVHNLLKNALGGKAMEAHNMTKRHKDAWEKWATRKGWGVTAAPSD